MRFIFLSIPVLLFLLSLNCSTCADAATGNRDLPDIKLSKFLKGREGEFKRKFRKARKRLRKFAQKYGFEDKVEKPFIDSIEIYGSKGGFDRRLREIYPKIKDKPIPTTFVGGIKDRVLFLVSPEVYNVVVDNSKETNAYEKLIAHELAHRLHIRLVDGNESKMGPMWFWEGFATFASDQYEHDDTKLSASQITEILKKKKRGSYRKYNKVFKHYLAGHQLEDYVQHAGKKDFLEWLGVEKNQSEVVDKSDES